MPASLLLAAAAIGATTDLRCAPEAPCDLPSIEATWPGALAPNPWAAWDPPPEGLRARYDVIVILGCPSRTDGAPSACQRHRVDAALELAAAGYGDRFIVSGAAVHNPHLEAMALRDLLVSGGVPSDRVIVEPRAEHTDENLYWSGRIMRENGWDSALVVSSPEHLLYAALCDATCCVRFGQMAAFAWPTLTYDVKATAWLLFPTALSPAADECAALASRGLCSRLDTRRSCSAAAPYDPLAGSKPYDGEIVW